MWKLMGVLLGAGVLVYGCGASDDRKTAPGGGEAGEGGGPVDVIPSGGAGTGGGAGEPSTGAVSGSAGSGGGGEAGTPAEVDGGMGGVSGAAGGAETDGGVGGAGGAAPVVLPDGPIVDEPYLCETAGPFAAVQFDSYFYLDDFDDGTIDLPGVTSSSQDFSSSVGGAFIDSVDCDDGVIDGKCTGCNSLFAGTGSLELRFDAQVLGALPTHVGMVWTDGAYNATVTLKAYDSANALIHEETAEGIGDNSNYGETEEDRFFGIVSSGGVKRVIISNVGGGIEIDHLQYGR